MHVSEIKTAVGIPQGDSGLLMSWAYIGDCDEKARVFVSHSRNNAASLGCRVSIYRVLANSDILVATAVLNTTAIEVLIDGPFDRIMVRWEQLGGASGDSLSATLSARREVI